ncbi:CHAP domain-containing protein [Candidatus Kaiserbacteria bacterium]|nr:MAG: CHAP domain-containing protein [Candidatus Kaiserbacteria bacterium]
MQIMVATIDTVYAWMMRLSLRVVNSVLETYAPRTKVETQKDTVLSDAVTMHEKVTSTFKTMKDVLYAYPKRMLAGREVVSEVYQDSPVVTALKKAVAHTEVQTIDEGVRIQKNTVMYVRSVRVPIFKNPTIEFDGQIGEVSFGEMVIVLEPRGRFYHIMWNTIEGWVLKEDIADRALRVYPVFVIGEENGVDHPNTAHTRAILRDVFGIARSEFALQSGEYVLYRLWRKGRHIVWPEIRPRVPGVWHTILRGSRQIHIGVMPKVGAVMEYMLSSEMGHVAYVEAVFPDHTITISEANFPDGGIYNERVLTKEEWKELHPVFMTVL